MTAKEFREAFDAATAWLPWFDKGDAAAIAQQLIDDVDDERRHSVEARRSQEARWSADVRGVGESKGGPLGDPAQVSCGHGRGLALAHRGVSGHRDPGQGNGSAVLSMYAALDRGPVTLISPVVAAYPLVTLLLSFALSKRERIDAPLMAAVTATVGGVVLLLIT